VNILDQHPGFELVGPLGDLMIELREVGLTNASEHRKVILARVPTCVVGEWWSDTSGPVWKNEGYAGIKTDVRPCDRSEWIGDLKGIMKHVAATTITVKWPEPNLYAVCVAIGMGLRRRGDEIEMSISKLETWIDRCRVASIDLVAVINAAGGTIYTPDRIEHAIVSSYGFEDVGGCVGSPRSPEAEMSQLPTAEAVGFGKCDMKYTVDLRRSRIEVTTISIEADSAAEARIVIEDRVRAGDIPPKARWREESVGEVMVGSPRMDPT